MGAAELRRSPSWRHAPDETGPCQTATLSNLGRTCRIERPTEPKGWTVIEIPSTPDPRNAVHKRRLRSVPRLGTPLPRSRRCPPPYPRSRPPASMVLRHLRQSRQLRSQTRSCGWCSDCERPGRRHTAHVSAECLALDQTSGGSSSARHARWLRSQDKRRRRRPSSELEYHAAAHY